MYLGQQTTESRRVPRRHSSTTATIRPLSRLGAIVTAHNLELFPSRPCTAAPVTTQQRLVPSATSVTASRAS